MSQFYARVFVQILDSSIAEDFMVRHVFEDMMKICDMRGLVDMTRPAMARRFNVPLEELIRCIDKLEAPDPASRDEDFEGRRIERLDKHRDWGWRILNFPKYEAIRTRADVACRVAKLRLKKGNRPESVEEVIETGKLSNTPEPLCRKFWLHYEATADKDEDGNVLWVTGEKGGKVIGNWRAMLLTWKMKDEERASKEARMPGRRRDRSEAEKEPETVKINNMKSYGESGESTPII